MAICRSNAHKAFIMKNLQEWVKSRQLMPSWVPLPKPQHLVDFERANRALIAGGRPTAPLPPPTPGPAPPTAVGTVPGPEQSNKIASIAVGPSRASGIASFGTTVL